jgi:hypothetical protein
MYRKKLGIAEAQRLLDELYELFEKFGISRKEFNQWVNEITIDRKKTEACIIDLLFCTFIKYGLTPKHLKSLSKRLYHKEFRTRHLTDRLKYLSQYVVRPSVQKAD